MVPHKAVADVSNIGSYRRGELLPCADGRANPLMGRRVFGVVFFGVVAVVTSPATAGCSLVYCSCSCSCFSLSCSVGVVVIVGAVVAVGVVVAVAVVVV